jgi:hypothetical protein
MQITTIGLDLAKNVFQVRRHGLHLMPHRDKFSGPKMGCAASFHSDRQGASPAKFHQYPLGAHVWLSGHHYRRADCACVAPAGGEHKSLYVIEEFKTAQRDRLASLCRDAGIANADLLADTLSLLLEGAPHWANSMADFPYSKNGLAGVPMLLAVKSVNSGSSPGPGAAHRRGRVGARPGQGRNNQARP